MQIVFDTSLWTQEQKNMLQATAVKLLYDRGVTYDSISIPEVGIVELINPSANISDITKQDIIDEYNAWKIDSDAKRLEAIAKAQELKDELAANQLTNITLAQVDDAIDAIANLADAKVFLKKLTRYIKAKIK